MTREEAIKEIRSWDFLNDEERAALETLIPELKESEDERIRKALIDGVSQIRCKGDITREQMVAYLEKQKEQKPAEWSEEDESFLDSIEEAIHSYYDLNHAPQYDYWLEEKLESLRPSWKPSEEDIKMLEHIIGQYETGNKNSKVMGYLPRVEELSFLKKVLSKWKN